MSQTAEAMLAAPGLDSVTISSLLSQVKKDLSGWGDVFLDQDVETVEDLLGITSVQLQEMFEEADMSDELTSGKINALSKALESYDPSFCGFPNPGTSTISAAPSAKKGGKHSTKRSFKRGPNDKIRIRADGMVFEPVAVGED